MYNLHGGYSPLVNTKEMEVLESEKKLRAWFEAHTPEEHRAAIAAMRGEAKPSDYPPHIRRAVAEVLDLQAEAMRDPEFRDRMFKNISN